jgi:hypothetical protein
MHLLVLVQGKVGLKKGRTHRKIVIVSIYKNEVTLKAAPTIAAATDAG